MRLIDADALKYKNLAEVNGRLTYVLTAEEIDNAPTVFAYTENDMCQAMVDGYDVAKRQFERPQSEEGAIQYALGYQDGFLDAKKPFERVEADDCEGCKYEDKTPTEFPCSECKYNHPNKFEWKKAKPYERPKPHPAAFCDGDCVHCKIIDECEKADGGES